MSTTLEEIEQFAKDVEEVWAEYADQAVIEQAERAAMSLRLLGARIREMRGLPLSTDGHVQFGTEENGTWCHESCPMPDDLCGELAMQQNS
jgi:hypothetical protein